MNGFDDGLLKWIIPLDQRDGEILMDEKQESLDYYDVDNKSFKRMDNLIAGKWTWLQIYTESFSPLDVAGFVGLIYCLLVWWAGFIGTWVACWLFRYGFTGLMVSVWTG
ncbi:unnamed protein product [Ilex paraguariensis]|uniref:Uncharacterized protein n=1 Tax=Ilex paraguariensis TaxID=185542 RepID=A0ABC8QRX2_9AQUA